MAKMTDYEWQIGDIANLLFDSNEIDLNDTTVIQVMIRMAWDAETGADETAAQLQEIFDGTDVLDPADFPEEELQARRDAIRRAKQRANEYGVLRNNLKRMLRDA